MATLTPFRTRDDTRLILRRVSLSEVAVVVPGVEGEVRTSSRQLTPHLTLLLIMNTLAGHKLSSAEHCVLNKTWILIFNSWYHCLTQRNKPEQYHTLHH